MGTGGFGGGSGSFGGGSGGGGGGGGARNSLLGAVRALQSISAALIQSPNQTQLTRKINELLRDRARAATMRDLFASPYVDGLLQDLLDIREMLTSGRSWVDVLNSYGVSPGPGCIEALCAAREKDWLESQKYDVDERFIERGSVAFRDFMTDAVDGNLEVAVYGDAAAVQEVLKTDCFENAIDGYLTSILTRSLEADCYLDLGSSVQDLRSASRLLAQAAYDRFYRKHVQNGAARSRDFLRICAENYFPLVVPK